jgi:Predicted periplasmic or secreted lipoprotein
MKTRELERLLKKQGCYLTKHGKKHDEWYSEKTRKKFRMPRHPSQEVATGTVEKIMKDAGLK